MHIKLCFLILNKRVQCKYNKIVPHKFEKSNVLTYAYQTNVYLYNFQFKICLNCIDLKFSARLNVK